MPTNHPPPNMNVTLATDLMRRWDICICRQTVGGGGRGFRWWMRACRNSQRLQSPFIVLENAGSTSCSHGNTGTSSALSSFRDALTVSCCLRASWRRLQLWVCSCCMTRNTTALLRIITKDKNQIRGRLQGGRPTPLSHCAFQKVPFTQQIPSWMASYWWVF